MPFITRTLLPKLRVTVPSYLNQAVPTVYLGMQPLPIATIKPLAAAHLTVPDKGVKSNVANISGISNGGFEYSQQTTGTKRHRKSNNKLAPGSLQPSRKTRNGNNPGSNRLRSKKKKLSKKKILLRNGNGQFKRSK